MNTSGKRAVIAGLAFSTVAALTGCTDTKGATKALDDQGFKDIHTDGYAVFGCGKGDTFHTEFHAKNPNGKDVHGVVCSGLLKASTVRMQ